MRYLFLLSLFIFSFNANAQNCRGVMNPRAFQTQMQQLRALPQEAMRFRTAMQVFEPYCLSSAQVFQVCGLLGQDPYRIDFAYASHTRVIDPENFYDVYDSFQLFSSAFRLHDLIGGVAVEMVPIPQPVPVPEPVPIPQPVCEVTPQDLSEIIQLVKAATFKDSMEKQAKMMIKSKQCFRTDQIVEMLNILTYDDSKLTVAKYAFDYCLDTQNYYRVVNSFTFKSYQDDLTRFIEERN
ncbi:MAG: hypothetical protein RL266_2322 [Bacteroidota bacterium]|jgi:hypothetical protein